MKIALTFDAEWADRPHWSVDSPFRILDALKSHEARATFFIQGRWAEANPRTARNIGSSTSGHLIGHHSHYHARAMHLAQDGLRHDIRAGAIAVEEATGTSPAPWFRLPHGNGHRDPYIRRTLESEGYRHIHWTSSSNDWKFEDPTAVTTSALAGARDGAIILFHTWPTSTALALSGILDSLQERGTEFVTVAELEAATAPAA